MCDYAAHVTSFTSYDLSLEVVQLLTYWLLLAIIKQYYAKRVFLLLSVPWAILSLTAAQVVSFWTHHVISTREPKNLLVWE